jgi:predicted Zn-dependent protease
MNCQRGLIVFLVVLASGCSSQGGTMAPVEDRTGASNNSANYGSQIVEQEATEPATKPYVAAPAAAPVQAPPPQSKAVVQSPPRQTNSAVTSLVTVADTKMKGGQYDQAAASLERALRHDAKNAEVWSKLAEVRLLQNEYAQAENTALKSNALSDGDKPLMVRNWRLISKSRRLQGDAVGADEAEARAYQLSR